MPPKKPVSGAAANQGQVEQKKKQSKKIEELENENESLKFQVARFVENFDYQKICTKFGITEENMLTMMQDENAKLRARIYELESSQISSESKEGADNKSDALKQLEKQLLQKDKDIQELQKKLDTKINELNEQLNKKENELQSIRKTLSTEIENLQEQLNEKDPELKKLKEDLEKAKKADNNTKKKKENTADGIERTTKEIELNKEKEKNIQLNEDLSKLETKVESLKKENEHLKTQLDEAHIKITKLKTELSSTGVKQITKEEGGETSGESERSENDDKARTIKERNEQIQQLENTLKQTENLKEKLQATLKEKEAIIIKTNEENGKIKQELKTAENEKQDIERCKNDLISKLATAESKIEELNRQLETRKDANNAQHHDHKLRNEHEIEENKKKIAELKNDLSASESKVKELEKQIKMNSDQMTEERKSLENDFKEKDKEINELRKSLSKSESEVKSLKDKISKLESTRARSASRPRNDELKKAHEEIEELKTRLSKVMGDKITENNPDIADLSDLNRPTKLAERYSELYDNEWTDAFEELENNRMESRQILDELYNILKDVYIFSQKVSYDYDKSVRSSAIRIPGGSEERPKTPNMNSSTRKQLVDLKKTFAPLLASDVFKLYLKKYKEAIGPKTKKFIGVCTEICWLMSVQDPPVVLDIEEPNGRFDKDKYKFYQRSGKQVDFIVWPPMRLHEKGPLLGKGVAEGK